MKVIDDKAIDYLVNHLSEDQLSTILKTESIMDEDTVQEIAEFNQYFSKLEPIKVAEIIWRNRDAFYPLDSQFFVYYESSDELIGFDSVKDALSELPIGDYWEGSDELAAIDFVQECLEDMPSDYDY